MSLLKQTLKEMALPLYCVVMIAWGAFCMIAPFANPWFFLAPHLIYF